MNYHQFFSVLIAITGGAALYVSLRSFFSDKMRCLEYSVGLIFIGSLSSALMSLVSNWVVIHQWILGENFYGSILMTPPILLYYIRKEPERDKIYGVTMMVVSLFMIFGKLNCLLFHDDCWGIPVMENPFFHFHPLPLYDMVFQLLLLGLMLYLLKRKIWFAGLFWIGMTALSGFIIQDLRGIKEIFWGFNFPQMIYLFILLIEMPLLCRYALSLRRTFNVSVEVQQR